MERVKFILGVVFGDIVSHVLHYLFLIAWGIGALGDLKVSPSEWEALAVVLIFLTIVEALVSGSAKREWMYKHQKMVADVLANVVEGLESKVNPDEVLKMISDSGVLPEVK